ncbi:MAG: hypothetical protein P8X74_03590 [Reinekea sp.]
MAKEKDEKPVEPKIIKAVSRESEIVSEAPEGFRELRPGVSLVGPKVWSSAQFKLINGKWIRDKLKNRFVPDSVAKMLGPKDEKEFNDWCKKLFL